MRAIRIERALQHANPFVTNRAPTFVPLAIIIRPPALVAVTEGIATEGTILIADVATVGNAGGSDGTAFQITVIDIASGRTAALYTACEKANLPQRAVGVG